MTLEKHNMTVKMINPWIWFTLIQLLIHIRACKQILYASILVQRSLFHRDMLLGISCRLEYSMLLNLPIILSSNSFLFHLLFPFLFLFCSRILSPPRSAIKLLKITNYIIHTRGDSILYIVFIDYSCYTVLKTVLFINCQLCMF